MMTYLKNMGGYTHSQLKGKTYEEIQGLYEREQKWIKDFKPMDSDDKEKDSKKKDDSSSMPAGGSRKKTLARKRASEKLSKESTKRQKHAKDATVDYEQEKEELRMWLKIAQDEEETVNPEILLAKYPIVDWEYKLLGRMEGKDSEVFKLTREDGSSSYHGDIQAFLRRLDRQDLNDLYSLVQKRLQDHPFKGHDLLLWGDLRMIFNPDEKDEIWINQ
ncbi:hypothetical protein Tco_0864490 [Tanacetum coccineum]